jgi:hypothetical protein
VSKFEIKVPEFTFEKDSLCKTNMACPDNGNAVFNVQKMDKTV